MFRKIAIAAGVAVVGTLVAFAGFDQYTSKNYTTLLQPTAVNAATVTNSSTTGIEIAGLIGNGCLVFGYNATPVEGSILSFSVSTCATTNGTYTTWTNSDGVAAWAFTNAAGFATMKFRPNSVSRYMRVTVTPTAVTNGSASCVLVTE
ncbi:MAG: hypothetical protein ABFD89_29140 [Bryobacteraceae bacterium]